MNYIDIILLVIWAVAIIEGLSKGLIKQIFGILALILACYCSFKFSGFAAVKITEWFNWSGEGLQVVAFIVTFIVVLLVVSLAGRLIDEVAKAAFLGWINRLLGAVFGWIKWNLILVILLYILGLIDGILSFLPKEKIEESLLYPVVEKFSTVLLPYLPFLES